MTSTLAASDILVMITLVGGIGGLWVTIIKTIRTEVGRIEKYVIANTEDIKSVRHEHAKSCNAFNREFVTKTELKERLDWNGNNRRVN